MTVGRRRVDEISIEELELLIAERRAARARGEEIVPERGGLWRWRLGRLANGLMTVAEVVVIVALVVSVVNWFRAREATNEAASASVAQVNLLPTPTTASAPAIAVAYLPSGHTPPTSPDGAQPIEASIPEHLRSLVEMATPAPLPTVPAQPEQPIKIVIPSIGVDHPVVRGDDWDSLKLGVGHHIGSANPGERGNMVLSAHNDIFGEIFRYLPDMQLEDEIIVHTANRTYRYVVKAKRIIEPTQVDVMEQTRKPVITLISCYPYLIDTKRIVVIGELVGDGDA
jgi:sortase A